MRNQRSQSVPSVDIAFKCAAVPCASGAFLFLFVAENEML
jgi:hypothetical protein